ncbi:Transposon Tn7 transposition protein TnsA [Caballeronia catudaia]|uniref:Transposon Tn7 transposition protein TnsA n=1 Tax=Caballeronia catudaia TaxID=1777136 RepID=A0A158BWL2_9BURK|nr:TnsA endonuclease N-terminal domain-containing protein [Caballeronia catudaia]SAK74391.1 Transposon Tn7 transposition protein TnsA [Caballeronia catudaia]
MEPHRVALAKLARLLFERRGRRPEVTMPRFRYAMTPAKEKRFMRELRGQGEGADYRPWLTVADVPSRGRSHRLSCEKTGYRTMHFLSDHEYAAFLEAWWDEFVKDIREQYPIDLKSTLTIAGKLNVKHPTDPRTGVLLIQTTDLLLTMRAFRSNPCHAAWAVKNRQQLADERTLEKLEIERRYWENRGVPWTLVVNDGLNSVRALNLDWLFNFELTLRGNTRVSNTCVKRVLAASRQKGAEPACLICRHLDRSSRTEVGAHLTAFRFLLFARILKGSFESDTFANQPLSSFTS